MSLPVCKFYIANRNCKFGKNCRYLHSLNQRPPHYSTDQHHEAVSETNRPINPSSSSDFYETNQGNSHEVSVNLSTPGDYPGADSVSSDHPKKQDDNVDLNVKLQNQKSNSKEPGKICHYFVRHGRCAFGRNCKFVHNDVSDTSLRPTGSQKRDIPPRFQKKTDISSDKSRDVELNQDETVIQSSAEDVQIQNQESTTGIAVKKVAGNGNGNASNARLASERICSYFRSGYCRRGRNCKFSHSFSNPKQRHTRNGNPVGGDDNPNPPEKSLSEKPRAFVKSNLQTKPRPYRPPGIQQIFQLSELDLEDTSKYRQYDITYLKRRFLNWRSGNESCVSEMEDWTIDVTFEPSDPDWPFDLKIFELQLTLPKKYPKERMTVKIPAAKQDLPESVRRYLEVSFAEWLSERESNLVRNGQAELMVRPFFKWLDRNFEDVMTDALKQLKRELAAKAAGIEFITADQLREKYAAAGPADENTSSDSEVEDCEIEDVDDCDDSEECLESDEESESDSEEEKPSLSLDAERKGTEIKLCNLQLKQNASSLLFEKLRLIVKCSRCKNDSELTITHGKIVSLGCDKCNQEMLVQYRPALAHQLSSVIGYLDLDGCQAFDLIFQDCVIVVSCLGCSKMTKINGMMSGQLVDVWCQACNARLKFASDAVKFYLLEVTGVDIGKGHMIEVIRSKSKKAPKDPAIREGNPLPDFGTCKHYKQSYRWLRFPCCGKAYPCDICHDKKEDHEMVMANRMICGHCCKEQNFSSKACTSCSEHMTKVHSAHWEGGTGCRDKISMSRNDQQKYKNMNKTISNHKKSLKNPGTKKTTKLRHV